MQLTNFSCNNMTKTVMFTLQEQNVTVKRVSGIVTTQAQQRI